jgi:hypothetical protein
MIRQGLAAGFALGFTDRFTGRFTSSILVIGSWRCRPRDLFLFERQLKLIEGFGSLSEPVAAQDRQLMLELLDPVIARSDLGLEDRQFLVLQGDYRLQRGNVIGQIGRGVAHAD